MNRAKSTDFFINGEPLPVPDAGIVYTATDLDGEETGRDEAGIMHRIVLREGVRTWEIPYAVLTAEDYQYIVQLLKNKPEFTFDFPSGFTTAYCSNHSVTWFNTRLGVYKNFKLKIIEC